MQTHNLESAIQKLQISMIALSEELEKLCSMLILERGKTQFRNLEDTKNRISRTVNGVPPETDEMP